MNFFKSKASRAKPQEVKQPEPRALEEIQKVYTELCARAGALQYTVNVNKKELSKLNEALENVNSEAFARQKLDEEAKKKAAEQDGK